MITKTEQLLLGKMTEDEDVSVDEWKILKNDINIKRVIK